jgi:hypothetical protein
VGEKVPSESKIIHWAKAKKITPDEFVDFMRQLGYGDRVISLYYEEVYGKPLGAE